MTLILSWVRVLHDRADGDELALPLREDRDHRAQQLADIDRSLGLLFNYLDDLGISVPADPEYSVQNLVCSGDFGAQLNLNAIAIGLGLEVTNTSGSSFQDLSIGLMTHPSSCCCSVAEKS